MRSLSGYITYLLSDAVQFWDRTFGFTEFRYLDDIGAAMRLLFYMHHKLGLQTREQLRDVHSSDALTLTKFYRAYNLLKRADYIREDPNNPGYVEKSDMGTMLAREYDKMYDIVMLNELNEVMSKGFIDDETLFFTYLDDRRKSRELDRKWKAELDEYRKRNP